MGKWLEYVTDASTGDVVVWKCDECGEEVETRWNFCPECGDPKTSKAKSMNTLVKALEDEHRKLREMQSATDKNVGTTDTISRQAALDIFDDYNVAVENGQIEAYSRDRKRLCDLPPALPEKRTEERTETHACDLRRYTFGNDEFNLEAAYHDCKLVFDGIVDDDSFQESDTGLILYYANEIIYALHEALQGDDTNVLSNDCISRQAAVDALRTCYDTETITMDNGDEYINYGDAVGEIEQLPPAQPELPIKEKCAYCPHCSNCDVNDDLTLKQRTGHWHITDAYPHNVYCSECHKRFAQTHWAVWEDGSLPRNFCPNCGVKMEGDAE